MPVKSILIDYLKKYPDLNMAVIRSLIDSAIEADVEETSLDVTPSEEEQELTPDEGKVWTTVNVTAIPVEEAPPIIPDYTEQQFLATEGKYWKGAIVQAMAHEGAQAPVPATFTLVKEGVVFTPQIDANTHIIAIQPDIAIVDKSALVVEFTFDTPWVVPGYTVQGFVVSGAGGIGTLTSGVSTLDFSSEASLEVNMVNKCAQPDAADNFVVKSQKWTITLLDPSAE